MALSKEISMSRVLYPVKTAAPLVQNVALTFPTNGTSNPVAASIKSTHKCSIAYSATGKYTITFTRPFGVNYGGTPTYEMATPDGKFAQIDSVTLNSSGYCVVVIGLYGATGTATAPASAATGNNVTLKLTVGA